LMKSVLLGSTVSVLLALSAISYARPFIQGQEPSQSPNQPAVQPAQNPGQQPGGVPATEPAKSAIKGVASPAEASAEPRLLLGDPESEKAVTPAVPAAKPVEAAHAIAAPARSYVATAYSLRGRTASGKLVSRGLIAADPSVLPLGTRVRVEAGSLSGEYLVADTGGAIKGRRIDIWTPTTRQALQFGRRPVKLTVLAYAAKPESQTRARRKH
jgi:3D (Asp-Asp-Asp) domain-containing protein